MDRSGRFEGRGEAVVDGEPHPSSRPAGAGGTVTVKGGKADRVTTPMSFVEAVTHGFVAGAGTSVVRARGQVESMVSSERPAL